VDVNVVGIRRVYRGRLLAYADVKFGDGVIVRDFPIITGEGQRPFIGVPRRSWTEDGQKFHVPLVEFVNGLREQVRDAVLARWAEEEKHGQLRTTVSHSR
jgi:DNA-binding cell septation regulator SpoVG